MVEFFMLVLGLLYLYIVVKLWRIFLYGVNVLRFYRHSKSDSVENYSNVNLDGETRKVRGTLSEFSEGKESLVTGEKSPFIGWYIQLKGKRIDGNLVWKTIGNGFHQEPFIIDTGEETFEVDFPNPELPTGKPVANRFLEADWSLNLHKSDYDGRAITEGNIDEIQGRVESEYPDSTVYFHEIRDTDAPTPDVMSIFTAPEYDARIVEWRLDPDDIVEVYGRITKNQIGSEADYRIEPDFESESSVDYIYTYISKGAVGNRSLVRGLRMTGGILPAAVVWTLAPVIALLASYGLVPITAGQLSMALLLTFLWGLIDILERGGFVREEPKNTMY